MTTFWRRGGKYRHFVAFLGAETSKRTDLVHVAVRDTTWNKTASRAHHVAAILYKKKTER